MNRLLYGADGLRPNTAERETALRITVPREGNRAAAWETEETSGHRLESI